MSAACEACGQDMARALTCAGRRVRMVSRYRRMLSGPWWVRWFFRLPERCRDCGVGEGGAHHAGCCVAMCLRCDEQRLSCGCDEPTEGRGCWACDRGVPHDHGGRDCPHELSSGEPRSCCADWMRDAVELRSLMFEIRTGRAAVPDSPAGIGPVDNTPGGDS